MVSENLTVTVTAVTEAAEQKLNSLKRTVRSVGIASGGSTAGVSALEGRVDSLARSSLIGKPALAGLTDEIEEEGDEATTSAAQTGLFTGALSSIAPAASGASVSLGVLSVTFQSLGAAVVVVTTALVGFAAVLASIGAAIGGVVAGAGALATAFAGIIGTGILAFGKQRGEQAQQQLNITNKRIESLEDLREQQGQLSDIQQKNLQQLKDRQDTLEDQTGILGGLSSAWDELSSELVPIITQFGEEFAPLIRSAIDTLPSLVQEVVNAAGGMSQLKDDVAALGAGFADALPGIVSGIVDLAREAMPVFQDFAKFLGKEGPDAISLMVQTAKENAPEFKEFLAGFRDALPDLIAFGNFIVGVLVPGLSGLGRFLSPVTKALGELNDAAKQIPDWVIDLLKGTLDIAVSGGVFGELMEDVFIPAGRRRVEKGPQIPGGVPDTPSTDPVRGFGTNAPSTIQIQGELVERDGEITAMIDESVELNNRRGARRVSRSSGDGLRGSR